MTRTLAVGLVGCGRLGEVGYLPALERSVAVELVAVADPDATRRDSIAARAGVPGFVDAETLLAGSSVDALVLATPAAAHLADAGHAADAGVAVLVEKPPAPDLGGAVALATLGSGVWLGFNRRFDPDLRGVRAATPATGTVDLDLSITYRRASWSAHTVRDDVLDDLGPHLVDLARWLPGTRVTHVHAVELTSDRAVLELDLDRGRARIEVAADRCHTERVVVRDSTGRIVARHRTGGSVRAVLGRLRPGRPHPLVVSLAAQLDAFGRVVAGGHPDQLATPADGIAVMSVLDAAVASATGGRPVPVSDPRESASC